MIDIFSRHALDLIAKFHGFQPFALQITGMKPQSNFWKQIPQPAAGYYTLRFAGLFDLHISIRFVFEI